MVIFHSFLYVYQAGNITEHHGQLGGRHASGDIASGDSEASRALPGHWPSAMEIC
jgi:hypothetical protein